MTEPLSPAAQAVLDAATVPTMDWCLEDIHAIAAAALRAAALYCTRERRVLMTIADELDAQP